MALPPQSGKSSSSYKPSKSTIVNNVDKFETSKIVKNTNVERNSFNRNQYNDILTLVTGYSEGMPLITTYYKSISEMNTRDVITDTTSLRDNIDIPLKKISNFEIKITADFSTDYDEEESVTTISGEGVIYPGLKPSVGDFFLYEYNDTRTCVFKVTNVEPLAVGGERSHRISFIQDTWLSPELYQRYEDRVKQHLVFDKTEYLGNNKTLLTEDSHILKHSLLQLRINIINYYYKMFYNNDLKTIININGVYDPYLVLFMNSIVSWEDVRCRVKQLDFNARNSFSHSVWERLLDPYNLSVSDLTQITETTFNKNSYMDTNVSELSSRSKINLRPNIKLSEVVNRVPIVKSGYVLSEYFYSESINDMSELDILVYEMITMRKIPNVPKLVSVLDNFLFLPKEEMLYTLPIYIYACTMGIRSIYPKF